jgi:serine O-acetyltransferase
MLNHLKKDLEAVFNRDPAARTKFEVILTYPGLHALWCHRAAHKLSRFYTGIEIHPAAKIGEEFFIDHGMGVVIGETAEVGDRVLIYHGVTLGGVSLQKGKRHPTIEDDVVIGAGAKVLGPITIGHHSRIGANAVVTKSAPPNSIIVGVPGQIIVRSKPHSIEEMTDSQMPDAIGVSMGAVLRRLDRLEKKEVGDFSEMHPPEKGIWRGEDFSI